MKVLPFEQSTRPASSASSAPPKESQTPDADPARQHAASDEHGHGHEEPGYGHGV